MSGYLSKDICPPYILLRFSALVTQFPCLYYFIYFEHCSVWRSGGQELNAAFAILNNKSKQQWRRQSPENMSQSNRQLSYRVLINYCVFSKILKYSLSWLFLGLYTGLHAWTTKWQVEHPRCSRTGRVKKNYKILRKKHNI